MNEGFDANLWQRILENFLGSILTKENARALATRIVSRLKEIVKNTPNQVDDLIVDTVFTSFSAEDLAEIIVSEFRELIGLPPFPSIGFGAGFDAGKPRIFLKMVRHKLTMKLMAERGISRSEAREFVDILSDDVILAQADEVGIPRGAIGDGTFWDKIIEWLPKIKELVAKLLPLILMFI